MAASATLPGLRAAMPADLPAIERLLPRLSLATRAQRFFTPLRAWPREMLRAIAERDAAQHFVVAELDGELVALGQLACASTQREVALVVADDWQRRGLGARLLDRLLDDARRLGLPDLRLETQRANAGMRRLAQRAGFALQPHPDDALLLLGRRSLAPLPACAPAPT